MDICYYLVDTEVVDIENLEFDENRKPLFDYTDSSNNIEELVTIRDNKIYEESYRFVESELDLDPSTEQFNENVQHEMENHFNIVDNEGNIAQ